MLGVVVLAGLFLRDCKFPFPIFALSFTTKVTCLISDIIDLLLLVAGCTGKTDAMLFLCLFEFQVTNVMNIKILSIGTASLVAISTLTSEIVRFY